MATYRWVGTAGTWDTTNTTNWAVTSGYMTASCSGTTLTFISGNTPSIGQTVWQTSTGTSLGIITAGSGSTWTVSIGGTYASQSMLRGTAATTPPTTADNVTFDNAGSYTVTMTGALACSTFSTNTTNAITMAAGTSPTLNCAAGTFSLKAGTIWSMGGTITFTGSGNVTTNGVTVDSAITIDGSGITRTLTTALTLGSARTLTHTNGTLDLAGFTLTVGTRYTTATGTKNLTFNGGTLVCPNANTTSFNNAAPTGFTTTAGTGTGTISMTAATAKTFVGGGSTFNCTINQGGAGTLTITGANTFSNITNTVQPASVLFTAGTTTTFSDFSLSGTAGNLITIASVTAAVHTLSKVSGIVSCDYLSITNSTATGGAAWYAGSASTNGGGNTGWIFTDPGVSTGAFFSVL